MVDVLEAIAQYELVSDGKVIVRDRSDDVCISSPDLCSLPAGGKSPKGVKKKTKTKTKQKQNKTKRNETKRNETNQKNKTKQNKTKQNKTKKQKRVKGLKKIFAHISHLTFSNISKAYRVFRSTDCIEMIDPAL